MVVRAIPGQVGALDIAGPSGPRSLPDSAGTSRGAPGCAAWLVWIPNRRDLPSRPVLVRVRVVLPDARVPLADKPAPVLDVELDRSVAHLEGWPSASPSDDSRQQIHAVEIAGGQIDGLALGHHRVLLAGSGRRQLELRAVEVVSSAGSISAGMALPLPSKPPRRSWCRHCWPPPDRKRASRVAMCTAGTLRRRRAQLQRERARLVWGERGHQRSVGHGRPVRRPAVPARSLREPR